MRPSLITQTPSKKFDGARPSRTAGVLRPGIRRLTAKARNDPKALAAYKAALATGATFEQVADAVKKACGFEGTTPQNTPFFTLRECVDPAVLGLVLERYGEEVELEGVAVKVIKRLPVSLYGDTVEQNLDYQFEAHSATGMKFWSATADASEASAERGIAVGDRVCRTFREVPKGRDGKAVRLPMGRDVETRGKCDPQTCPQYQSRECNLRGKFYFHIPGVGVSAPFEMPIGSKYFGIEADQTLELVRNATNGNLTRFDKPVFFLTKERRTVPMLDPDTGKPKKVEQIITVLEAAVDVPKLRLLQGGAAAGQDAALLLEGRAPQPAEGHTPSNDGGAQVDAAGYADSADDSRQPFNSAEDRKPADQDLVPSGRSLQARVAELSAAAGFTDGQRVKAYATQMFGTGWVRDSEALQKLVAVLESIVEPRAKLVQSLKSADIAIEDFLKDDVTPPFWDFIADEINARLNAT